MRKALTIIAIISTLAMPASAGARTRHHRHALPCRVTVAAPQTVTVNGTVTGIQPAVKYSSTTDCGYTNLWNDQLTVVQVLSSSFATKQWTDLLTGGFTATSSGWYYSSGTTITGEFFPTAGTTYRIVTTSLIRRHGHVFRLTKTGRPFTPGF